MEHTTHPPTVEQRLRELPIGRTTALLGQLVTRLAADEYRIGKIFTTLAGAVRLLEDLDQIELAA
ncbi:MAG TPA: hypothetical protein PKK15_04675 [Kouleothrix sp.]|nr:hypothetical protein [Kouleothrix sp.]